jgi:hypothetical protein
MKRRSLLQTGAATALARPAVAQGTRARPEHNLSVIEQFFTCAILLEEDQVVADSTPRALFARTDFERIYFSLTQDDAHVTPGDGPAIRLGQSAIANEDLQRSPH